MAQSWSSLVDEDEQYCRRNTQTNVECSILCCIIFCYRTAYHLGRPPSFQELSFMVEPNQGNDQDFNNTDLNVSAKVVFM